MIDYDKVPSRYMHCFNHGCPQCSSCLHYLAGQAADENHTILLTLNPACYVNGGGCPHYRSNKKIRVAWGVQFLWDEIPHKKAIEMKAELIRTFGRTLYYRYFRNEIGILPAKQQVIRNLFMKNGIYENPHYEKYTEEYDW